MIPTLFTPDLTLRAPVIGDFELYAETCASPRASFIGGPMDREEAWYDLASAVAGWVLQGFGYWTITDRKTTAILGWTGFGHLTTEPEPELGWCTTPSAEGKGVAFAAASAARDWCFETLNWSSVVSYIDPGNARSIALAQRMGAVLDTTVTAADPKDLVYRHYKPGGQP